MSDGATGGGSARAAGGDAFDGRGSDPTNAGDGRNIDPAAGLLLGEAAEQATPSERATSEGGPPTGVWTTLPSDAPSRAKPSYYERPLLKEPTWIWTVPAYFFAGGAAGAAAALAAVAQVADRRGLAGLIRRCRWLAAIGGAAGTAFLVADLGRPERFLNMLRVFRPSSPMNMGSWVLATTAPLAAGSALLSSPGGPLGAIGDAAGLGAGVLGLPLAGYTAVLLSNTAVPVWQQTRRSGPFVFVGSAMTGASSILQLFGSGTDRERAVVRRYAIAGAATELAGELAIDREAKAVEHVAKPLHEGLSGSLLRVAKVLSAASLMLTFGSRRSRWLGRAAGALGLAAALASKFGLFEAGKSSAADPHASFEQQRAGHGAAEVTGSRAVASADGAHLTS